MEISNIISIEDSLPNQNQKLSKLIKRLKNRKNIGSIGKKRGKSYEMLGEVKDVYLDEKNSKLYILDTKNIGVNVYDLNGNYLQKFTREGKGPGELINPEKIIIHENLMYVLNWSFNINRYSLSESKLNYFDELTPLSPPLGFCINDNLLFINSTMKGASDVDKNHNILAYNVKAPEEPINSFGKMYKSNSWIGKATMSMGGIECLSKSNTIVQYFRWLNLIYGYKNDGSLNWVSRIKDFNFINYEEEYGRMSFRWDSTEEYDEIKNTVSINKEYFILQVLKNKKSDDQKEKPEFKSYIINYNDGQGYFLGTSFSLIYSISLNYIVFYDEIDFPKLEISKY